MLKIGEKLIKLSKAKPADIKAMQTLVAPQVEAGIILPRSDDEIAQNIRSYILAKSSEQIIGFGALHIIAPDLAEVRSLIVAPSEQKSGIGAKIVNGETDLNELSEYALSLNEVKPESGRQEYLESVINSIIFN